MIKRRNLDNSLIQWIMTVTGLGPGIGDIKYVAPASSATSQFRTQLEAMKVSSGDIFTGPKAAEAAIEGYRNDVVLAMPGTYSTEGDFTWSKRSAHLLGLGQPVNAYYSSGDVIIRNLAATDAAYAMLMTGSYNQIRAISFHNFGENAACVSSVKDQGRNNHYHNVLFGGHVRSEQAGAALATCLWIDTAAGAGTGYGLHLIDCNVGLSGSSTRTNNNTLLLFGPTGGSSCGSDVVLRRTTFNSRSVVAGCSAIKFAANYTVDRMFLIDDCVFYNFYVDYLTSTLTEVINNDCGTYVKILVKNSHQTGWASWEGTRSSVYLTQADASGASGIAAVET